MNILYLCPLTDDKFELIRSLLGCFEERKNIIGKKGTIAFSVLINSCKKQTNKRRGIEWSLRASASMRAVCLYLRARAFDKFFLRAASTLEITDGEQRAP